jgi:hypothetical protein
MSIKGATYSNKNVDRQTTHQLVQNFEWRMTDIMEEYNYSSEQFLNLIFKYISNSLIKTIKKEE